MGSEKFPQGAWCPLSSGPAPDTLVSAAPPPPRPRPAPPPGYKVPAAGSPAHTVSRVRQGPVGSGHPCRAVPIGRRAAEEAGPSLRLAGRRAVGGGQRCRVMEAPGIAATASAQPRELQPREWRLRRRCAEDGEGQPGGPVSRGGAFWPWPWAAGSGEGHRTAISGSQLPLYGGSGPGQPAPSPRSAASAGGSVGTGVRSGSSPVKWADNANSAGRGSTLGTLAWRL